MAIDTEQLRSMTYFSGITAEELDSLKDLFRESHYEKGAHFLTEGEISDHLFFIVSGLVKVYKTSTGGREQVLHIAPPGDSLNDVSLYDGGPTAAGMAALTPVTVYMIRKQDIIDTIKSHPQIMLNVIRALAQRIRRDSNLLEDLSSSQVLQRLAKLFLGQFGGEEFTEGLDLTQKDIASLVGSSREMVNRSLRILEEKGAIRLMRRKILVLDKNILADIARESIDQKM